MLTYGVLLSAWPVYSYAVKGDTPKASQVAALIAAEGSFGRDAETTEAVMHRA